MKFEQTEDITMVFLIFLVWMIVSIVPLARTLYLRGARGVQVSKARYIRGCLILAGGFISFLIFNMVIGTWVNVMWFEELGYIDRFWTIFWTKWFYFLIGFIVTAVFLFANIFITKRKELVKVENMYLATYSIAIVLAFLVGIAFAGRWKEFLLYKNQTAFGIVDPIFGQDVGFYVFTMPIYELISWVVFIIILLAMVCIVVIYEIQYHRQNEVYEDSRRYYGRNRQEEEALAMESRKKMSIRDHIRFHELTHLSILGIFLMVAATALTMVARWGLLFSERGAVFGAGRTDVHAQLPAYNIFIVVFVGCIIVLAISAITRSLRMTKIGTAIGFGSSLLVWIVGVWIIPAAYQHWVVSPNEIEMEREFIKYDIEFTRQAYGLTEDHLQVVNFPVNMKVDNSVLSKNQTTLDTVRLWDFRMLQSTFIQTQVFRSYYTFPDVDVVRYRLGDKLVQLMCSAREMDHELLTEKSKTWQNRHLFYTHGYGLVANPVNVFLPPEGLPEYWIKDIPPASKYPELEIKQPRIYFGESTTDYVYVMGRQAEFDYPQEEQNVSSHYDGSGGIEIGTGLRKFAIAWEFDGFRLLASDEILPTSRLMYDRDIRTRVKKLAPFLWYDNDPYQVIADGSLWYMWDAYTTTDCYPYSARSGDFNYIRNSVKVVINAYTGKVDFYIFDERDPLIRIYSMIFPDMFKPASAMPASLKQHIRYPEDLMKIQGKIYSTYHMTDPTVFYNKEDAWEVAQEVSGNNKVNYVLPYYVIMKIPGEQSEEFVLIYPFTPYSNPSQGKGDSGKSQRLNMVSWLAGRCDGKNYGKLLVYLFPKDYFINGPQQIGIRINQDEKNKNDISLWNQSGSQIVFGNLLVLPLADFRLMYVQPLYLQAEQGKMPELKRVFIACGDRLAYGASFEEALRKMLDSPAIQPMTPLPVASLAVQSGEKPSSLEGLIRDAARHYNLYREYSGQGKFSEAGKEMEELGKILSSINGQ